MFGKPQKEIADAGGTPGVIDLSRFNDPVALKTEWSPVDSGTAIGNRLVRVSASRWELRATARDIQGVLIFFLFGLGLMIGPAYSRIVSGTFALDKDTLMFMLIGLVFAAAAVFLLYSCLTPIVFDTQKGFFWKGRTVPGEAPGGKAAEYSARLEEIHALQLLTELCTGRNGRPYSRYRLNLVLKDASRINVTIFSDRGAMREAADALSQFLDRPVWDAS